MDEIWKVVPGFPRYEVSDQGRVRSWCARSWNARQPAEPHVLRPARAKNGYLVVGLHRSNERCVYQYVHRLVLEVFVGPAPEGMVCRHFPDRNPHNNALCNLSWGTERENAADKEAHGTQPRGDTHWFKRTPERMARGERRGSVKLTDAAVREIRMLLADGVTQRVIAARFGVDRMQISRIKHGKTWSHVA